MGKKIKVRAGEPINVSIPISGAPIPTCEWSVNDKKLVETKRVLVKVVVFEFTVVHYSCRLLLVKIDLVTFRQILVIIKLH